LALRGFPYACQDEHARVRIDTPLDSVRRTFQGFELESGRPTLTGQFLEEFLFVHAVLEGLAAVDEDDGDLVVVLAAQFGVGVDVYLSPLEAAALMEFDEALLNDLAEMAPFAGIHDDFPVLHNQGSLAGWNPVSNPEEGKIRAWQKRADRWPGE
jgi:hypothetical protein